MELEDVPYLYKSKKDRIFFSSYGYPTENEARATPIEPKEPIYGPNTIASRFIPFETKIAPGERPYVEKRERLLKRSDYTGCDEVDQEHRDYLKREYAKKPKWVPRALPGAQEENV